MAERWQQWMPFHIDKFRGSPEVQAMHPAARLGYIYLLASAWQSDDCTVSSDPMDLATESGLGDELWAVHGPRILRKFAVAGGRLQNAVLLREWAEARKVFEKRKSGAVRTNSARSAGAERTQTARPADTQTLTGTGTKTEVQKRQKTSRSASDPRHELFKHACEKYAEFKGVPFLWDGREAGQLGALLKAAPSFTVEEFQTCLRHRARSDVPHGDRPSLWLGKITSFQQGPLNAFNKPEGSNGAKSKSEATIDAGRDYLERRARELGISPTGDPPASAKALGS